MTAIKRTAWPVLGRPGRHELDEKYTLEPNEIRFIREKLRKSSEEKYLSKTRHEANCFRMAILLKCFQRLHYFPTLHAVPESIANHIARQMKIKISVPRAYKNRRMLHRHQSMILKYLKIKPWLEEGKATAIKIVEESAQLHNYPADIINYVMERLIQDRYELPAYNLMNRLSRETRHHANQQIFDRIASSLSEN